MARRITRSKIDQQIATLMVQRDEAVRREQEKVGRCADKAGILELELTDTELLEAFKVLVSGFRTPADTPRPTRKAAPRTAVREVEHVE
jgi:hypothetical protein